MAHVSNLYVGGLPKSYTNHELYAMFESFGEIATHKVMVDPVTSVSKGFGFVQYADVASATAAIAHMNGLDVEGKALVVKAAERNAGEKTASRASAPPPVPPRPAPAPSPRPAASQPQASNNLYVSGIPGNWQEGDLNMFFGTYGTVVSSIVLRDRTTGAPKGAAMVRFPDTPTATSVMRTLNGRVVEGGMKPLEVKFADRAEEKGVKRATVAAAPAAPLATAAPRYDPYRRPPGAAARAPPAPKAPQAVPSYMLPPAPVHVRAAPTAGELQIPRRFHVSPEEYTNLHITGLESNVTDLHLYQAFAGFGAISSVKAMVDLHGNCKGWGFVQFMYAGDAEAAIESTNGMVVGTKQWVVSHHKKKGA